MKNEANGQRVKDLEMIENLLGGEGIDRFEREKFESMRDDLTEDVSGRLSPKQRAWVKKTLIQHTPVYENLVSDGKAPIGQPVTVNVGRLPLTPPGRGPRVIFKDGLP